MPLPVLRAATHADQEFLAALYASTRADEMVIAGWPEQMRAAFCAQQFAAQSAHYRTHYADASFSVVELQGSSVGRLIVHRSPERLHVVDISLLPAARGRGIGTILMETLFTEARQTGQSVGLSVEKTNRARRFYDRLGFQQVGDQGVSWLMEWRAVAENRAPAAPQPLPRTERGSLAGSETAPSSIRHQPTGACSL